VLQYQIDVPMTSRFFKDFIFFVGGRGRGEEGVDKTITRERQIKTVILLVCSKNSSICAFDDLKSDFCDLQNGGLSMFKPICEFIGCQLKTALQSAITSAVLFSNQVILML
jgi:hypothetical protein